MNDLGVGVGVDSLGEGLGVLGGGASVALGADVTLGEGPGLVPVLRICGGGVCLAT